MSDQCEHDWRVNPFVILTVNPPRQRIFCIKCHQTRSAPFHFKRKENKKYDPRTWKKYTGEVNE